MTAAQTIKLLADMELEATLFAQKCSKARKLLEKNEGSSPASRKGTRGLSQAQVIELTTARRKRLLKSK